MKAASDGTGSWRRIPARPSRDAPMAARHFTGTTKLEDYMNPFTLLVRLPLMPLRRVVY